MLHYHITYLVMQNYRSAGKLKILLQEEKIQQINMDQVKIWDISWDNV